MLLVERFPLGYASQEGHKHADFSDFIMGDWGRYEFNGEMVFDAEFHDITESGGLRLPMFRKQHLKKKMCQELSPIDQTPYKDPYEFWSIEGDV